MRKRMGMDHILWRRLDAPGHDACRLAGRDGGWTVEGVAVFSHGQGPAKLAYELAVDGSWRARSGWIEGWIGSKPVSHSFTHEGTSVWTMNGKAVPGLDRCVDLDFGFTPATNLPQFRRLALEPGQAADAPAAWFDIDAGALACLHQRYERRGKTQYWYEAQSVGYAGLLEVFPNGFVQTYPGLWLAES
jgi:uncharacterized protein